jgi:hypothetical protein
LLQRIFIRRKVISAVAEKFLPREQKFIYGGRISAARDKYHLKELNISWYR